MFTISKQRGFTLLELMLVVAIMAVISVAGISYLKEKALNTKIDKTALQIQQWLQASSAFYATHSAWPKDSKEVIDAGYMPANSEQSVWFEGGNIGTYMVGPTPNNLQVQVSLQLPISVSHEIAQRLANKLPFAEVYPPTTGNLVRAFAPIPGYGGGGDGFWNIVFIKTVYLDEPNKTYRVKELFQRNCPPNMQPDLFVVDNGFYNSRYWGITGYYPKNLTERVIQVFPDYETNGTLLGWTIHVQNGSRLDNNCEFKPTERQQTCKANKRDDNYQSTILLLGVCKPIVRPPAIR